MKACRNQNNIAVPCPRWAERGLRPAKYPLSRRMCGARAITHRPIEINRLSPDGRACWQVKNPVTTQNARSGKLRTVAQCGSWAGHGDVEVSELLSDTRPSRGWPDHAIRQ